MPSARILGCLLALCGLLAFTPPAAATTLPGPLAGVALPVAVDVAAPYEGQAVCDPTDKPGALALKQLLLTTYGQAAIGISRSCTSSVSEHFDGRAVDWMRSVRNPAEAAQAQAFLAWLLESAADGTPQEMARRLGIMYLIYNNQMIRMYDPGRGWTEYKGCLAADRSSPGLDTECHRDHIHISMTWDGALMRTSWWTGVALAAAGAAPTQVGQAAQAATTVPVAAPQAVPVPAAVPGRPRSLVAKARKGSVFVRWKAPRHVAQAQVSSYLVAARAGSANGPVAGTCTATPSARMCWIPNLPRGLRYWVSVSAANLAGSGSAAKRSVRLR